MFYSLKGLVLSLYVGGGYKLMQKGWTIDFRPFQLRLDLSSKGLLGTKSSFFFYLSINPSCFFSACLWLPHRLRISWMQGFSHLDNFWTSPYSQSPSSPSNTPSLSVPMSALAMVSSTYPLPASPVLPETLKFLPSYSSSSSFSSVPYLIFFDY